MKSRETTSLKWYANESNAAGKLDSLRLLLGERKKHGAKFGYHVTKCHLITKSEKLNTGSEIFRDANVEIEDGQRVLRSVFASDDQHAKILRKLAEHAKISPQNVNKSLQTYVHFTLSEPFESTHTCVR